MLEGLPARVIDLLQSEAISEFATISATGVPIDTPMLYFPSEGLRSFDVGTGLAYPAKAERARRNPKVGFLVEGAEDQPVVAIAGMATVRDTDLQATTDRYVAETGFALVGGVPWSLARQAVWYWTRMIVQITPARICWWDDRTAMDRAPHRWEAPADTVYPSSDPAPPGELSAPSKWPQRSWQELAQQALDRNAPGHLTLFDDDGFPIPFPIRSARLTDGSFRVDIPKGAPWRRTGKASLTFQGRETFIGDVTEDGGEALFQVERALPVHPQMDDPVTQWKPTPENREKLMARLRHETARRSQPIPTIPETPPVPTEGARLRMARVSGITPDAERAALAQDDPMANLAFAVSRASENRK